MKLVVVGNGVAGITCALEVRRRVPDATITIVSGESDYFFSRTALMYAFMDRMRRRDLEPYERRLWIDQRLELVRDWAVDLDAVTSELTVGSGRLLSYDRLVLAVGASARRPAWPGLESIKDGVVGFVSMQDLDACERLAASTREAVIVGGGLIGIELVESLVHHGIRTTFLVRDPYYWPAALAQEEADLVQERLRSHGVDLVLSDEVDHVEPDAGGRIASLVTRAGRRISCQLLGIAVGVEPNVARLRAFKTPPQLARGIVVDPTLQTSLPGVYACGDCAEVRFPDGRTLVELIWYSAKRQGLLAAGNVLGDGVRYEPPVFFNSSKFFDVEYTTVGQVLDVPNGTPSVFRRLPGKPVTQRIVHDGTRVLGFNMLGSRWDHETLVRWVEERASVEHVLKNLAQAQHDVEFGRIPLDRMQESSLPIKKKEPRR